MGSQQYVKRLQNAAKIAIGAKRTAPTRREAEIAESEGLQDLRRIYHFFASDLHEAARLAPETQKCVYRRRGRNAKIALEAIIESVAFADEKALEAICWHHFAIPKAEKET